MKQRDSLGVGICLGVSGAVIALARSQPSRLVALASVSWPEGLWQHPFPQSAPALVARRMLVRARRQLALPRWCPVSVVVGRSLSGHRPQDVLAASAGLLARANLSQAWVTTPDRADALRREAIVPPGPLGAAAANTEAGLAIGAAIASLAPPAAPPGVPLTAMPPAPLTIPPPADPAPGTVLAPTPWTTPIAMPSLDPAATPSAPAAMPHVAPAAISPVVPFTAMSAGEAGEAGEEGTASVDGAAPAAGGRYGGWALQRAGGVRDENRKE